MINLLLFTIFLILGFLVRNTSEGLLFDVFILDLVHKGINPVLLNIMKLISLLGSAYVLVPVIGILTIYFLRKKKYYNMKIILFNTLGSYIINHLLKLIFNRSRPMDFFLVDQTGLSYPSGHSMVVMSMYLSIGYLLFKDKDFKNKRVFNIIIAIVILSMGFSRIYLGVHWPTDIIGGYIMGYLVFSLSRGICSLSFRG